MPNRKPSAYSIKRYSHLLIVLCGLITLLGSCASYRNAPRSLFASPQRSIAGKTSSDENKSNRMTANNLKVRPLTLEKSDSTNKSQGAYSYCAPKDPINLNTHRKVENKVPLKKNDSGLIKIFNGKKFPAWKVPEQNKKAPNDNSNSRTEPFSAVSFILSLANVCIIFTLGYLSIIDIDISLTLFFFLLSLVPLFAILAITFAGIGLHRIKKSDGKYAGKPLAGVGLALGIVAFALCLLILTLFILFSSGALIL